MSYLEYIDMFAKAQQKDCPYRAFMLDVVNSRNQLQYFKDYKNHYEFIDYLYSLLEREEQISGKRILLKDENNQPNSLSTRITRNANKHNPMTLGDMVAYFVYNGSISQERFISLVVDAIKKYNISYPFHFATGVYETNDYGMGGTQLYKGYLPQILEKISKNNGIVISKDTVQKDDSAMETL